MSALEAIPALTGTEDTGFAWTIYTGDLVAHDPENQLSRLDYYFPSYFEHVNITIPEISWSIPRYYKFVHVVVIPG